MGKVCFIINSVDLGDIFLSLGEHGRKIKHSLIA